jgi:hypothetical protein
VGRRCGKGAVPRPTSVDRWGRHSCLPWAGRNACPTGLKNLSIQVGRSSRFDLRRCENVGIRRKRPSPGKRQPYNLLSHPIAVVQYVSMKEVATTDPLQNPEALLSFGVAGCIVSVPPTAVNYPSLAGRLD